jgi:hypothetical protein
MNNELKDKLDAAAFRELLSHLDARKDVQNIDLMILANFYRNCLGKWYKKGAEKNGVEISDAEARKRIYGIPYEDWKEMYQKPATEEQLKAMKNRKTL